MKFIPSSPVVFVLVIVAFFAMGMLAGKMFGKKKAEKFEADIMGEFNTPANMASGPKVLPKVPENIGVISSETWCKKFNC
jgi:hypothetical protein